MTPGQALGLGGRLRKLRAMSPSELLHRLQYRTVIEVERRQHRANWLVRPDRLQRALREELGDGDWQSKLVAARKSERARFFPSVGEHDAIHALFETRYQGERAATMHHAARARDHRFEFFGQEFSYGGTIPWQADPVSGRQWPSLYHADVPVHGGDVGFGDVKHVWELSRQQYVMDLGKSWFLSRNRADLGALQSLVRSWIDGNPYATGVNWACALEPAFRVFSWLWAYYLSADELDDEFHLAWLGSFLDHGRFIERHLEHYSSPYNHLIAEAAALYMLGVYFPEFRDAERWRERGLGVMTDRLGEQFYADGGSVEQSTFYHHATIGFYLLAMLTARAAGAELPATVRAAVERGLDYSMKLTQPDGSTPRIGGADDGKPIRMEHLPFWDFRPYLSIGAVVFNRPDFKAVAGRFYEDALWLLGPAGLAAFDAMESRRPGDASTSLPASGYYVMRSDWSPRADYVCFDCGEQAAGMRTDAVPNSMHGHADCLSVVAWLDGRPTLVDSGLFAYNCGGAWEDHFRETAAHNTARVDGRDQATHIRKMAWSHSYRPTLEGWNANDRHAWVIGAHDGYARGPAGVRHRRAVWLRPGSYILVYDEFVGTGRHEIEVNWQFAPGVLTALPGGGGLFDDAVEVAWVGSESWAAQIACGGPGPADGWIAPSLGLQQAAPRLRLTCATAQPRTTLLTVVAARAAGKPRVSVRSFDRAGTLVAVAGTSDVDLIAASGISDGGPIETDAPLAVCRTTSLKGSVAEVSRLGGTRVRTDDDALRRLGWPVSESVR